LKKVYEKALADKLTIASPRVGCVLAGGTWEVIGPMIEKCMTVETYIYTLESQRNRWQDAYEN
jgi:hypothetical protein